MKNLFKTTIATAILAVCSASAMAQTNPSGAPLDANGISINPATPELKVAPNSLKPTRAEKTGPNAAVNGNAQTSTTTNSTGAVVTSGSGQAVSAGGNTNVTPAVEANAQASPKVAASDMARDAAPTNEKKMKKMHNGKKAMVDGEAAATTDKPVDGRAIPDTQRENKVHGESAGTQKADPAASTEAAVDGRTITESRAGKAMNEGDAIPKKDPAATTDPAVDGRALPSPLNH